MSDPGPHIRTLAAAIGVEICVEMNAATMMGSIVADYRAQQMIQAQVDQRCEDHRERGLDCPQYAVVPSANDETSFTLVPRIG